MGIDTGDVPAGDEPAGDGPAADDLAGDGDAVCEQECACTAQDPVSDECWDKCDECMKPYMENEN